MKTVMGEGSCNNLGPVRRVVEQHDRCKAFEQYLSDCCKAEEEATSQIL